MSLLSDLKRARNAHEARRNKPLKVKVKIKPTRPTPDEKHDSER